MSIRIQLLELERRKAGFERQGIRVAAPTADSSNVVRTAATRLKLTYPVLSDPELKTVTALGASLSGSYLMALDGIVQARYLVEDFENYTAE